MREEAARDLVPDDASRSTPSSSSRVHPSRGWMSAVRRPRTSPGPKTSTLRKPLLEVDDSRRDSALASSTSTTSADLTANTSPASPASLRKTPSLPVITVHDDTASLPSSGTSQSEQWRDGLSPTRNSFQGIDLVIPTGDLDDLTSPTQVSFSKRGSMLLGGKRPNKMAKPLGFVAEDAPTLPSLTQFTSLQSEAPPPSPPIPQKAKERALRREEKMQKEREDQRLQREAAAQKARQELQAQKERDEHKLQKEKEDLKAQKEQKEPAAPTTPQVTLRSPSRVSAARRAVSNRVLSTDEAMLSRKVRSMYKHGNESAADWDGIGEEGGSVQNYLGHSSVTGTPVNGSSLLAGDSSSFRSSQRDSVIVREPTEIAGGVEDWTDLEGGDVDRYGFIIPKKTGSRGSANGDGPDGPDEPRMQRVTTLLKLASEEPRKKGALRSASRARSIRSAIPKQGSLLRRRSQRSSRAGGSVFSNQTSNTRRTPQRPLRQAANRLPHNKDRRLMDEASDMLKLPPGLAELAEEEEGGRAAQAMKQKEMEREEKWRKMAKVVQSDAKGGGMMFEFDVKDPKVVSRTWKGIPDRWRGTAWYAFLSASAKTAKDSPTDEELVESFYALQEESSADDMQIDVDVPRTINRHIMFRRRYRGGQRLLFRVLHAMSLYLPDTGYVQGMAALAATLLCYYEEDKAFVMLVRLWMHRGLERLYEQGFTGLMEALDEFEKNWMRGGDVAKKLNALGISSTAYGTRWYLTLFNYSLPFPAQLRVWDVFMLLGDTSHSTSPNSSFSGDLDVLHATSAALIDATREILLDSDFENAMKVLTSWIPIRDEDLLMKVAKAEYKMRKKRNNHAGG